MKREFVLGLLSGIAVGGVLGLLFAPQRDLSSRAINTRFDLPSRRFVPFRSRVKLGFEDTAESIKPAI